MDDITEFVTPQILGIVVPNVDVVNKYKISDNNYVEVKMVYYKHQTYYEVVYFDDSVLIPLVRVGKSSDEVDIRVSKGKILVFQRIPYGNVTKVLCLYDIADNLYQVVTEEEALEMVDPSLVLKNSDNEAVKQKKKHLTFAVASISWKDRFKKNGD